MIPKKIFTFQIIIKICFNSTVGGNLFQGEKLKDQLHTDAINEHFRYIYERIEDLAKRIEKLELNHV